MFGARPGATLAAAGPGVVGVVGAGQLARMLLESASALGLRAVVMAEDAGEAAALVAGDLFFGSPLVEPDLRELASRCDVVTFDHELVDLELLSQLEDEGVTVRPSVATLQLAVDKRVMRAGLHAAGVPVPRFATLPGHTEADARPAIEAFAAEHGWPLVLKAGRGGYDGHGVWPVEDEREAAAVVHSAEERGIHLLVEEYVPIEAELAVLVARRPGGEVVSWPAVETAQVGGVCREVLVPGRLGPDLLEAAGALARRVADVVGSVGVLAVELFSCRGRLLVNEVAARPHNTGHWTIEGAVTSQFENHLRAVLDLPLGDTTPGAPNVASVNVFGDERGEDPATRLAEAFAVDGAHVHLYGKAPRPGRKLGHVTVCGDDPADVRSRAWRAARALGTPVPAGIDLPVGVSR
ncbi:MAG TPA: 5-(carboxyamino)imidazole ribonucleotide synthase [Acidimicrobiales bacterium]|nr:5-(carboxyamino)imidazole ribonucleotide synthase [Acidimicrobiales bacterium]